MSTVGQAKITFEADTSQVSDQVVQKLEKIVERLSSIVDKMSQDIDQKSSDAGASLGDNIADGADKAEKAVDGVDASGLGAVEEAAAKAGAALGEGVADGAAAAESAVDGIDASGLSAVEEAAAKAGAAVGSDLADGAAAADAAIDAIDGSGLSTVEDAAARAGAAVSGDITTGAAAADAAIDSIDGSGLVGVEEAAARAGATLNADVSAGAAAAEAAVDGIDGSGLVHVEEAAGRAGAAISGDLTQGAAQADAAIDSIDGSGLVNVEEAAARAGAATSEMGAKAQAAGAQAQAGAETGKRGFMGMDFSIKDVIGRIGVLGGAFAAVAGPAAILKGGFDRLMDIQKAEILFQNIGLTAEETGAQMDQLSDQVTGTSVSLSDAAARSAAFAQAGVELGQPMNDAVDAFTALSSAAGDSAVDVGMVLQQISAQGKVTGGDLMQLSTAGINASAWLAEEMGISMEEVSDAVSKGEVDFETFVAAVNNGAGDLAQEMGQTLPAKLGNFKTALANLGANIIEPFLPLLTVIVEVGIEITKSLIAPIRLVSGFFTSGGAAATVLATALKVLAGVVAAAALGWGLWAAQFVLWPAIVGAASAATGAFAGVLALLRGGLLALRGALMSLWTALLTNPIGWVVLAVGALVAVFAVLWKRSEAFRDFWIGLWSRLTEPVKQAVETIKGAWDGLTSIFRGEIDDDGVGALGRLIGADKVAWIIDKVGTVKQVWGEIKSVFSGAQVEDGGALSKLIGIDRAERIMEIVGSIKMAWEELKAAFSGEAFGSANLERIFGESGGQTILAVFEGIGNGARLAWEWIQKIGESLREAGQAIGTAVWETLKSVFESLVDVGKALWDALVTIGKAVWDLVQALAPILMPILKVIGGIIIGTVVVAFFVLMGAIKVVSKIIEVLAKVIQWLVENVLGPLISVIGEVASWLVEKFGEAIGWVVDKFTGLIEFFTGLGEQIGEAWSSVWQWLQEAWDTFGQPIVDFIKNAFLLLIGVLILLVFDPLKAAWDAVWLWLSEAWQAYGQPVVDWVINAFNWMRDALSAAWDWVKTKFSELWQWAQNIWNTYGQPVVDWIVGAYEMMRAHIFNAIARIKDYLGQFGRAALDLWNTYVQPMVDWVVNGFNRIREVISGWKDKVVSAVSDAGTWLLDAGKQVVQGMIDGIKGMVGNLVSTVKDFAGTAINAAKERLGIASPSKVFRQIGEDVGEGMALGIASMQGQVASQAGQLAGAAAAGASASMSVSPTINYDTSGISMPSAPAMDFGSEPDAEATGAAGVAMSEMGDIMATTATEVLDPMWLGQNEQLSLFGMNSVYQLGSVVTPAWQMMAADLTATKAVALDPAMAGVGTNLGVMSQLFPANVSGVISPALAYMASSLWNTLNTGVNPVFAGIRGGLSTVTSSFTTAVGAITAQWARVREATAAPVRFTINSVFNDGIVGMWNSVSELLGTTKMSPYPVRFATGGVLPGYSPGTDNLNFINPTSGMSLHLSGGEAIMRPEWTRAVGGPAAVEAMNKSARTGGIRGVAKQLGEGASAGRFATGGVLDERIQRTIARARREHGKPYQWGGVGNPSWDCSGLWSGIQRHLTGGPFAGRLFTTHTFMGGGGQRLGWVPGLNGPVTVGVNNTHMAGTLAGINMESASMPKGVQIGGSAWGSNHPSFSRRFTLRDFTGAFIAGVAGGGADFGAIASEYMKPHKDKMGNAVRAYTGSAKGIMGREYPAKMKDKLVDATQKKIDKLMEEMMADPGGAGVARWEPMVRRALAHVGFPVDERNVRLMLAQIASESGGNPGITQSVIDVNSGGNEAVGLLQVIPGTFAAHRDPSLPNDRRNPFANMVAALRYYRARYGMDLGRMWGKGHGYHEGGLMDEGQGWFQKTAIKPERVLSPQQTKSFDQLVGWLDKQPRLPEIQHKKATPGGDDGTGRVTKQVFVTQHITGGDAKKTADEIDRLVGHL